MKENYSKLIKKLEKRPNRGLLEAINFCNIEINKIKRKNDMEAKIIEKITIVSGQGVKSFEVGIDGVVCIKDNSAEYEDRIYFLYSVFGEDEEEIARIENAPTVTEFKRN